MRLTIFHKLFISILVTSVIMMAGMALLINNSFQSGLQTYLSQRELKQLEIISLQVGDYYSSQDGWQELKAQPSLWENLLKQIGDRPLIAPRPSSGTRPPIHHFSRKELLSLHKRIHLLDANGRLVFANIKTPKHRKDDPSFIAMPISVNNKTVGWITMLQKKVITGPLAESFYQQQLNNFYLIAIWVALFSFIVAGLLVRHFLKPLKNLHSGAIALQQGDFKSEIPVQGNDELAELTLTFNQLSKILGQQKLSREQWLADISHELRTPIAVLISEIEAIEDGIRKPEAKYIHSLHDQVMNLSHLVEDIYQLSLSDSGVNIDRSQSIDITKLLERVANQNEARLCEKNIQLKRLYKNSDAFMLRADPKSLTQLISNIFENSYRYTDAGGLIQISMHQDNKNIELIIEDSSPGVPQQSLNKLFERLYRVDKSRSRANGGSGLGLSICQNIVKAHNGQIVAQHSPLGGLQIKILFPRKDN